MIPGALCDLAFLYTWVGSIHKGLPEGQSDTEECSHRALGSHPFGQKI